MTFRWKADGLDDDGLAVRVGASAMTLGGLAAAPSGGGGALQHLAAVEVLYSTWRLDGSPPLGPWDPSGWDSDDGWAATFGIGGRGAAEVYRVYDDAVARSRTRVAAARERGGLDQPVAVSAPDGSRPACGGSCSTCSRSTAGTPAMRPAARGR